MTKYNLSAKTSLSDDSPLLVITLSVADVDILGPEDLSSRWAVPLDDCKGSKNMSVSFVQLTEQYDEKIDNTRVHTFVLVVGTVERDYEEVCA